MLSVACVQDVSPLFMRWCAVMVNPVSMEWTGVYKAARGLEEVLLRGEPSHQCAQEVETHMPTGRPLCCGVLGCYH